MMKLNACLIKILKTKMFYIEIPLKIPNPSYCFILSVICKIMCFQCFLFLLCPCIFRLQLCMILYYYVEGFCHPIVDESYSL